MAMKYSVSYKKNIDSKGNKYNQLITLYCTESELYERNNRIAETMYFIENRCITLTDEQKAFKDNVTTFKKGWNYCNPTMVRCFCTEFGMSCRVKLDRNTLIDIRIYVAL